MMKTEPTPFTFNRGALASLARLLATENLTVIHEKVDTASFDTEERILTLPEWEVRSLELYHMLVEHEVAHALWTTPGSWIEEIKKDTSLKPYLNIVEDARIERLFKRRFPGSRRDFRIGYEQLFGMNIFGVRNMKLNELSIADRLNLFFKFGDHLNVPFYSDDERAFIEKMEQTESFDDVVRVAKELREFSKSLNQQQEQNNLAKDLTETLRELLGEKSLESDSESEEDSDEKDDGEEPSVAEEEDPDFEVDEKGNINQKASQGNESAPPSAGTLTNSNGQGGRGVKIDHEKITTNESFESAISKMSSKPPASFRKPLPSKNYIIPERLPYADYIIPYSMILEEIKKHEKDNTGLGAECFGQVTESNKPTVNFLYSQFEMKKAAKAYARTMEAKTGILNPSKLHSYSIAEDIFKRSQVTKKAKNHAFVMLVDFSGSIGPQMYDILSQTMALTSFCRKAKIPHVVYGFTDRDEAIILKPLSKRNTIHAAGKSGAIHNLLPSANMRLLEIFSNKMSASEYRSMCEALLEQYSHNRYPWTVGIGDHPPRRIRTVPIISLGGTPLNCGMLLALPLMKDFQTETKTDVVSLIVLTDGESGPCLHSSQTGLQSAFALTQFDTIRSKSRQNLMTSDHFFTVEKPRYDRDLPLTAALAKNISDHGFNTIMYRIENYHSGANLCTSGTQIVCQNNTEKREKARQTFCRDKSTMFENTFGFDRFYIIGCESTKTVSKNMDHIRQGETAKKIMKEFMSMKNTSRNNRRVLTNFIETISSER